MWGLRSVAGSTSLPTTTVAARTRWPARSACSISCRIAPVASAVSVSRVWRTSLMPRFSSCSDTAWYGCRASSSSRSTSETRTRARTRGEAVGPPRSTAVAYPVRIRRPIAASIPPDEPDRKVVCRVLRSALGLARERNVGRTSDPDKKHGGRPAARPQRTLEATGIHVSRPGGGLIQRPHEVAPFRPRAVVIADVRVAEEVLQDEPRVGRPLPDPAVRDDLLVRRHAFRFVEGLEFFRRLERPILVHRLRPGDILRSGDVTAALRVLRRVFWRREDLAAELLRAAYVDEDLARLLVCLPHVREVRPERLVRFLRGEGRRGERGHVFRHRQVLSNPLLPPAVQEDDLADAVILEHPEREGREPVVEVAVQDDLMVVRDAEAAEEGLEAFLRDDVPAHRIVDVLLPVDQDRPGDVPEVIVRRRVVVHLDDPDGLVPNVPLHPARVDQDFGMRVSGHLLRSGPVRSITPLYFLRISIFVSD